EYAGAAHLCVAGAQAGPAGMVRFVGEESLRHRVVDRAPEVVASSYDEAGRVQAWVVGPGGGSQAGERLAWALEQGVPLVVDADALQHLPDRFEVPALLTPHAGELARMLGVERDDVEAEPLAHATRAAEQWGATVLLKGERTLVVRTGAPARVNLVSTPWLGTAGSGDVLAGFAGALVAAGLDPLDAGSVAALLHGRAGQLANPGGPFTASDVARRLPSVVAAFLRGDGA
ncbi:MAG: NAD(P)H-hydrate dehydratase, partial [Actinomycetales bacterium]